MKYVWPFVASGGILYGRNPLPAPRQLTQIEQDYLLSRLFDRCELDVVFRANGQILLVARKPSTPRRSK